MSMECVWVFNGNVNHFPAAVFTEKEQAENWVRVNKLSGTLTKYPLDVPVYEWAVEQGFIPREADSKKIANFSSAYMEHFHYRDGEE